MKYLNELTTSLNLHFHWNKARMECFAKMLLALLAVKTVNLTEIATAFHSDALFESRYKRLYRFFSTFEMDFTKIARWLFSLMFDEKKKVYVILDRTNWFWGKSKINVFMLAIAYEGIAIPVMWRLLNKAGSTNVNEQKEMMKRFLDEFGVDCIAGVLGDREFVSGGWFKWLNQKKVPFYIRIKENTVVCIRKRKYRNAKKLFNHLQLKEKTEFGMTVWVHGVKVFLAGARSERGELMIVATNRIAKSAIAIYCRRWEIENLFQALKGRGFHFEETHLVKMERIEKLIALLSIAVAWVHKVGEWYAEKRPIKVNRYRNGKRNQSTYFRLGLNYLRELLLHFKTTIKQFRPLIQLLHVPISPGGILGKTIAKGEL